MRNDAHTLTTAFLSSIPRGGNLGPLSADSAAIALVGFTVVNGYPMWSSKEAISKSWGIDVELRNYSLKINRCLSSSPSTLAKLRNEGGGGLSLL
jgi:hypothetical protein